MQIESRKNKEFNFCGNVPSDKSITHRAVMLASVAKGQSTISNPLLSLDTLATIDCMTKLGAEIEVNKEQNKIYVRGIEKTNDNVVLNCENSGTTMRVLSGLVCGLNVDVVLDGDDSLRKRPMNRVIEPLSRLGAKIESNNGYAPLKISKSILKGANVKVEVSSAQVKSAVILAGLFANGKTTVEFCQQTRDHTERMLKGIGANILVNDKSVQIQPSDLNCFDIEVCGDISSAAFVLAYGVINGKNVVVKNVGINPTRAGFLTVLEMFGAKFELKNRRDVFGEPVCDIHVFKSELKPVSLSGELIANIIDELPIIAVMACFAKGKTVVKDAKELRVKESDRIKLIVENLKGLNVESTELEDGFEILGTGEILGDSQFEVKTCGDHRIAMSMAIAQLNSQNGGKIDDFDCCSVSFPNFKNIIGV